MYDQIQELLTGISGTTNRWLPNYIYDTDTGLEWLLKAHRCRDVGEY